MASTDVASKIKAFVAALVAMVVFVAALAPEASSQAGEVFTTKQRVRVATVSATFEGENVLGTLPGTTHVVELRVYRSEALVDGQVVVTSFDCDQPTGGSACEEVGSQTIPAIINVQLSKDRSTARIRGSIGNKAVSVMLTATEDPYKVRSTDYFERDGLFTKQTHRGRQWVASISGRIGGLMLHDATTAVGTYEALTLKITTNDPTDDIPADA